MLKYHYNAATTALHSRETLACAHGKFFLLQKWAEAHEFFGISGEM
jgi:hypothetical protein